MLSNVKNKQTIGILDRLKSKGAPPVAGGQVDPEQLSLDMTLPEEEELGEAEVLQPKQKKGIKKNLPFSP